MSRMLITAPVLLVACLSLGCGLSAPGKGPEDDACLTEGWCDAAHQPLPDGSALRDAEGESLDSGDQWAACEPWTRGGTCLGPTTYLRCNALGTEWDAVECPGQTTCYFGACVQFACPPEERTCLDPYSVQQCLQDGDGVYAWVPVDSCGYGVCRDGQCQSSCDLSLKEAGYLGCEYWAVMLDNWEVAKTTNVAVVVSLPAESPLAADISFLDMSKTPPQEMDSSLLGGAPMILEPGELAVYQLPLGNYLQGSAVTRSSYRIASTQPVSVHQFNPLLNVEISSNDASLLFPSSAGADDFWVMSWPQRFHEEENLIGRGYFTVVATQEGETTVEVWPTARTLAGHTVPTMEASRSQPYVFQLEYGQVLNVETDGGDGADLTGTRIRSSQMVSVFVGHECANVPLDVPCCDHLEMQMLPVRLWGSDYVADAFRARAPNQPDTWRVMSGADGVTIQTVPPVAGPFQLDSGQWVEFDATKSFVVVASGPVLVAHFLQGGGFATPGLPAGPTHRTGDPSLTFAVPVERFLDEYIIYSPTTYFENYINIVCNMDDLDSIRIDDHPLSQFILPSLAPTPIGSGPWTVGQASVTSGVHVITSPVPIGVTAYGYSPCASYSYPGGLNLRTIP